jgi:ribosome-binding protein aMBF1 (putative translation factor)
MIKNERQYRITKREAERFEQTLERFSAERHKGIHPKLVKAQRAAIESQIASLRAEISEYETLRRRKRKRVDATALEQLPQMLIQARIAAGITQKQLAEKLGLKEQQIQRYEATDYRSASLSRVIQIARAIDAEMR